jgi:hypothetical protein
MVRDVKAKLSHKSPLFENLKMGEKCSFQLLATRFRCADRLGALQNRYATNVRSGGTTIVNQH